MSSLTINIDGNKFELIGKIDEHSDLSPVFKNTFSTIYLDVSKVKSLNSSGVRSWVGNVQSFPGEVIYSNCSVAFTEQFSMVPEILGPNSKVKSFFALFYCEDCEKEEEKLLAFGKTFDGESNSIIDPFVCPICESELEEDFDRDEYFLFLDEFRS